MLIAALVDAGRVGRMVKRQPGLGVRLGCLFAVALAGIALACKYSVRDVGFVDLTEEPYLLHLFLPEATDDGLARDARSIATATFLESNLELEVVTVDASVDPELLALAKENGIERFPGALLVAPSGDGLNVSLPGGQGNPVSEDDLWTLMESTASSPKREAILETILDAFAVVVLLESDDQELNRAARTAIDGAIEEISRLMPKMPKPVDTPPNVLTIASDERDQESTLLFSLGFDLALDEEPQAAILIGRGRRLGPPLQGGLITKTKVQQMMALIGQDCECDLDRSWMQGPMVPLRWDSGQQKLAYDKLAFDPESPLVKAEISRILARGPNARGEVAGKSDITMDTLFLGYSEELVDATTVEPSLGTPGGAAASTDRVDETEHVSDPSNAEEERASVAESDDELPVTQTQASASENKEAESESTQTIPVVLWTVLALGVIALVGGGVVVVRGSGV